MRICALEGRARPYGDLTSSIWIPDGKLWRGEAALSRGSTPTTFARSQWLFCNGLQLHDRPPITCPKLVAVLLRRVASEVRPDAEALAQSRTDPPVDRTSEASRPRRTCRAPPRLLRWAISVRLRQAGQTRVHPRPARAQARPIQGIDVSKYQGKIDWASVRSAGTHFAFIKATEGGSLVDERFIENWHGAKQAGVARGAYHFMFWCRSADEQAAWFKRTVPNDPDALPPVLDLEWNAQSRDMPAQVPS